MQYVGQTRTSLKQRMLKHRNKFNDKNTLPRRRLYQHFDQHVGKFKPIIIPMTKADPKNIHAIESYWINQLGTLMQTMLDRFKGKRPCY